MLITIVAIIVGATLIDILVYKHTSLLHESRLQRLEMIKQELQKQTEKEREILEHTRHKVCGAFASDYHFHQNCTTVLQHYKEFARPKILQKGFLVSSWLNKNHHAIGNKYVPFQSCLKRVQAKVALVTTFSATPQRDMSQHPLFALLIPSILNTAQKSIHYVVSVAYSPRAAKVSEQDMQQTFANVLKKHKYKCNDAGFSISFQPIELFDEAYSRVDALLVAALTAYYDNAEYFVLLPEVDELDEDGWTKSATALLSASQVVPNFGIVSFKDAHAAIPSAFALHRLHFDMFGFDGASSGLSLEAYLCWLNDIYLPWNAHYRSKVAIESLVRATQMHLPSYYADIVVQARHKIVMHLREVFNNLQVTQVDYPGKSSQSAIAKFHAKR